MFGLSNFAAGSNDALEKLLVRRFEEQIERQKRAEAMRALDLQQQRDAVHAELGRGNLGVAQGNLGVAQGNLGLRGKEFDQGVREYTEAAPQRIAGLAHTQAQTSELQRRPTAEREGREHAVTLEGVRHGYNMQEIGAQGQNALRVANVRHPDGSGQPTAKEVNEVQETIDLIDSIKKDPALSHSVGAIQGRGAGRLVDNDGYERFKALHEQLVGKLQLANSGKLKGQGAVSNIERDILRQASTALRRELADPDYVRELDRVMGVLQKSMSNGGAPQVQNMNEPQEFDYVPGKGLVPRKR